MILKKNFYNINYIRLYNVSNGYNTAPLNIFISFPIIVNIFFNIVIALLFSFSEDKSNNNCIIFENIGINK